MTKTADFGSDLLWGDDLDPFGREVEGLEAAQQRALSRLETKRGTLIDDDPAFGEDLEAWLSAGKDPSMLGSLGAAIEAQIGADEVVETVRARVTHDGAGGFVVEFVAETAEGPFSGTATRGADGSLSIGYEQALGVR